MSEKSSGAINRHLVTFQKIRFLKKNNDVSYMYVDKLYALVLLHNNLQMQLPGDFSLICDTCGEITLSRSRKFSSTSNLTK